MLSFLPGLPLSKALWMGKNKYFLKCLVTFIQTNLNIEKQELDLNLNYEREAKSH